MGIAGTTTADIGAVIDTRAVGVVFQPIVDLRTMQVAGLEAFVRGPEAHLRVFVEVNDRALVADPAGLVTAVDRARSMGWGIAVDDVGSSRAPIVLLPVVHADVVKVDLGLLRGAPRADASAVLAATLRHVERTGAALCVERIESDEDLRWALAIGAVLGQGHHLGVPGPLPEEVAAPRVPVPLVAPSEGDAPVVSPFDLLPDVEPRRVERRHFLDLARTIAFGSISPGAAPVVLVGLARNRPDPEVAASFPSDVMPVLYVMFGTAVHTDPVPGPRAVRVDDADPLAGLEFLVSMNEKGGSALIGRALPDGDLEVVLTQDRELTHTIARHLVRRIPPTNGDGRALPPPDLWDGDEPDDDRDDQPVPEQGRRGMFGRRR